MKRTAKLTYIINRVLMFLILAMSITGAIINDDPSVKSIYVFNAVQSFLFLLFSLTPTLLKKLRFEIPDVVYVVFVLFMLAHFFLGEICGFYARVSWWDAVLHTFAGVLLTFISFSIISLMNEKKNKDFKLNIYFSALFAFALTVTLGVIWEIIEFTSDSLFGSNMQRAYESLVDASRGPAFVGGAALLDTMKDLILDSAGSAVTCIICIILYKTKNIDFGSIKLIKRSKKPEKHEENAKENSVSEESVSGESSQEHPPEALEAAAETKLETSEKEGKTKGAAKPKIKKKESHE